MLPTTIVRQTLSNQHQNLADRDEKDQVIHVMSHIHFQVHFIYTGYIDILS